MAFGGHSPCAQAGRLETGDTLRKVQPIRREEISTAEEVKRRAHARTSREEQGLLAA